MKTCDVKQVMKDAKLEKLMADDNDPAMARADERINQSLADRLKRSVEEQSEEQQSKKSRNDQHEDPAIDAPMPSDTGGAGSSTEPMCVEEMV